MAFQMQTQLTLSSAVAIKKDLGRGKNLKIHVATLQRCSVEAEILEKAQLEEELLRHLDDETHGDAIKKLLMKFAGITIRAENHKRITRSEDKAKKQQTAPDGKSVEMVEISKQEKNEEVTILKVVGPSQKSGNQPHYHDLRRNYIKTFDIRNLEKASGSKRTNDYKVTEEPKKKVAKVEEKRGSSGAEKAKMNRSSEGNKTEQKNGKKEEAEKKKEPKTLKVSDLPLTAEALAKRLRELPPNATFTDAQNLLRSFGKITPALLEDAEEITGRKMRRVDEVWWLLLLTRFGLPKTKTSLDVREIFAKEQEKQRKRDEETMERLVQLYGK